MSLLKNLTTDSSIADEKDFVGGGGPLESGLYEATITLAYVMQSAGGATGMVTHFKTDAGREFRQTFWMTSGTAKGGKNYYEKNGEKNYLPGFLLAQSLSLLVAGKEIADCDIQTKVANVWNKDAKAEVPTKVEMVMDLLNKNVLVGLLKQKVDKTTKADSGEYVPTGETREENEVDKFFRASDRKTTAEIRGQAEEAVFVNTWNKKWEGNVRDKSNKGGNTGMAGAMNKATSKKPQASLFGA